MSELTPAALDALEHECAECLIQGGRQYMTLTRADVLALVAAARERDALKADQQDWRNGVDLIRSALSKVGPEHLRTLSCSDIAHRVLEVIAERDRLKAQVERLEAALKTMLILHPPEAP